MINVNSNEKSSTIRLKQKTKDMLEELAKGKETHEEIVLRLIKLSNTLNSENKTSIKQRDNIIGTKYERVHKTININLNGQEYLVVCTYNDLSLIALMQNKSLKEFSQNKQLDWRLDLEIVNINDGSGWKEPKTVDLKQVNSIYFVCVKTILEDVFDIKLYQFSKLLDYFEIDNWIEGSLGD